MGRVIRRNEATSRAEYDLFDNRIAYASRHANGDGVSDFTVQVCNGRFLSTFGVSLDAWGKTASKREQLDQMLGLAEFFESAGEECRELAFAFQEAEEL